MRGLSAKPAAHRGGAGETVDGDCPPAVHKVHQGGTAEMGRQKWGGRISRLPWTKEETKAHIKRKYLLGEQEVLHILAGEESLACRIHAELNLTRATIKATLQAMADSRKHQMVFASVACGTFFKHYAKTGRRLNVKCTLCKEISTLQHLQMHMVESSPDLDATQETSVEYLVKLIQVITPQTTTLPIPIQSDPTNS